MVGKRAPKIPPMKTKEIILKCKDKRTQALIAYQYSMGNRSGELAREYHHTVFKKRCGHRKKCGCELTKIKEFKSDGIRCNQVFETDEGLEWESPNFKSKRQPVKSAWVLYDSEPWLYNVLVGWLNHRNKLKKKYLFNLRHSRIKGLIDEELKRYNSDYSTHSLRRSRADYIASKTKGNPFAVKEVLGHARIETSAGYVSFTKELLKEELRKGRK